MSARISAIATAAAVGLGLVSQSFGAVAWSTPSGTSPGNVFKYTGGGSDVGLFGDPVVSDGGFTFFPSNFFAESSNGVAATKRDRMFVTLAVPDNAVAPNGIIGVQVGEIGDWAITGPGSVRVSGLLTATVLGTWISDPNTVASIVGTTYSDTMDADGLVTFDDGSTTFDFGVSPGQPITSPGDGEWNAKMVVKIPAGFQAKSIQLVMNNVLQATSSQGGTAFIEKKVLGSNEDGPGVRIRILVPEPTTMTAIAGASLVMLRRKRK
jgi:hypothetical protein